MELWSAHRRLDTVTPHGVSSANTIGGVDMQAYCMKCRKKVEIKDPRSVTLKNKKPATQGVCPTCGTKVFRIGKG